MKSSKSVIVLFPHALIVLLLLAFLHWLLVEPINEVKEGVAGHDVGEGLGAALGVDNAGDVVELAKDVEAVEHHEKLTFEEGSGEAGVPDEVVGVQQRVGIASTGV